jgi:hypothetical protein
VFNTDYDKNNSVNNWSYEIKQVMNVLGLNGYFESKSTVNLSKVDEHINDFYCRKWHTDVQHIPKLRTYRLFKNSFKLENYISLNTCKNERSILCQFRFGILPLRIETGRFVGEAVEHRL